MISRNITSIEQPSHVYWTVLVLTMIWIHGYINAISESYDLENVLDLNWPWMVKSRLGDINSISSLDNMELLSRCSKLMVIIWTASSNANNVPAYDPYRNKRKQECNANVNNSVLIMKVFHIKSKHSKMGDRFNCLPISVVERPFPYFSIGTSYLEFSFTNKSAQGREECWWVLISCSLAV